MSDPEPRPPASRPSPVPRHDLRGLLGEAGSLILDHDGRRYLLALAATGEPTLVELPDVPS